VNAENREKGRESLHQFRGARTLLKNEGHENPAGMNKDRQRDITVNFLNIKKKLK
jgi:hypothetical protein